MNWRGWAHHWKIETKALGFTKFRLKNNKLSLPDLFIQLKKEKHLCVHCLLGLIFASEQVGNPIIASQQKGRKLSKLTSNFPPEILPKKLHFYFFAVRRLERGKTKQKRQEKRLSLKNEASIKKQGLCQRFYIFSSKCSGKQMFFLYKVALFHLS